MNEEIVIPIAFFITVAVCVIGYPLVRGYVMRQERRAALQPPDPEQAARLARIETAVEAMAIEIERISEGQRFVTRVLSERAVASALAAPKAADRGPHSSTEDS